MNRSTTLHPRPTAVRDWRPRAVHLWWVLGAVVVVIAGLVLAPLLQLPPHVDALTVDNPTTYDVTLEASDDGGSWTPVGTVDAGDTVTFDRVYDQGDTWLFRFSSQGREGGQIERTRDELQQGGWQVPVPESVAETLRKAGAPEAG